MAVSWTAVLHERWRLALQRLSGAERDRMYAEQAGALPRLCRVCAPNRRSPHHSCARTYAGVAHVPKTER
jgi:hypothetical protein